MWWARLLNVISGLLAGGVAASTNSYESISTVTVGAGGASSVVFSSIPSTFKHLQIRYIARGTASTSSNLDLEMYFNTDTTQSANYRQHRLIGTGAAVSSDTYSGYITPGRIATTGALTNNFAVSVCDILDYTNTNKNKVIRALSGLDNNDTTGLIFFDSGVWLNTAAISTITLTQSTYNISQYSQFALYGIKG